MPLNYVQISVLNKMYGRMEYQLLVYVGVKLGRFRIFFSTDIFNFFLSLYHQNIKHFYFHSLTK
jgi:hypothetical protein